MQSSLHHKPVCVNRFFWLSSGSEEREVLFCEHAATDFAAAKLPHGLKDNERACVLSLGGELANGFSKLLKIEWFVNYQVHREGKIACQAQRLAVGCYHDDRLLWG
jgi:hypothetical protein